MKDARTLWFVTGAAAAAGVLAVAAALLVARPPDGVPREHVEAVSTGRGSSGTASPPSGLALPFAMEQIREGSTDVHPFGVVRFSQDRPEYGHSGIDVPLGRGAAIFAVADGEILKVEPAGDDRPGQNLTLRITAPQRPGEAWVFLYEHIIPDRGLAAGSRVRRVQRLGRTALETSYNNHLQLSYAFNAFSYYQNHTCWVDQLTPEAAGALRSWFAGVSARPAFRTAWQTSQREGRYEFRGLLDARRFPNGPQLCYPTGTDVRVPAEG